MRPDQIRRRDSEVGAAASAGRPRGGCPGRNVGPECAPGRHRRRQWAGQVPLRPCPAWVTKRPRPLLGDVRVGGFGGWDGGAATTTAAASAAAAFAGGRADVRGGWAPGAKRLGACGPLAAAAATANNGVSREGAEGEEQPLRLPAVPKGVLGGSGLSVAGREAREGLDGETRAQGGGLYCKVWGGGD